MLRPLTRNGFGLWARVRSTRRSQAHSLVTPAFLRHEFPRLLCLTNAYRHKWPNDLSKAAPL